MHHYRSAPPASSKAKKSIAPLMILIVFGLLIAVPFFGYRFYLKSLDTPNSTDSTNVAFEITEGETVEEIATDLVDKGLISERNKTFFKLYLKQEDLESKLPAGSFLLPRNFTIKELAEALQNPKKDEIWVTIKEGLRHDEIAQALEDEFSNVDPSIRKFDKQEYIRLVTDQTFIAEMGFDLPTLEGFLFPDRYLFFRTASARDVIQTQLRRFIEVVGEREYTHDDIIIASLIEREGRSDYDRPLISDIIRRRINEGWLIQIDATLLYYYKDWKREISISDLEFDQPYNSYKNLGLPPTAICNPGAAAIIASLEPEPNEYYFYIHDDSGKAHFATTLEQHNNNILRYLR